VRLSRVVASMSRTTVRQASQVPGSSLRCRVAASTTTGAADSSVFMRSSSWICSLSASASEYLRHNRWMRLVCGQGCPCTCRDGVPRDSNERKSMTVLPHCSAFTSSSFLSCAVISSTRTDASLSSRCRRSCLPRACVVCQTQSNAIDPTNTSPSGMSLQATTGHTTDACLCQWLRLCIRANNGGCGNRDRPA